MVTVHVDDVGATGSHLVLEQLVADLRERYGDIKLQRDAFRHIGHDFERVPDGTWKSGLDYSAVTTQGGEYENKGGDKRLPEDWEIYELRCVNGELAYLGNSDFGVQGGVATCQQSLSDPRVEDLRRANKIVKRVKEPGHTSSIWFPKLRGNLKLVVICASCQHSRQKGVGGSTRRVGTP